MVRLNQIFKLKFSASSLTEVVTATSIILIVFAIALATLNNVMMSSLQKDNQLIKSKVEELIYRYRNDKIKVPYRDNDEQISVSINKINNKQFTFIEFTASLKNTNKTFTKRVIAKSE